MPGIIVSYNNTKKGYRVFDSSIKMIIISKDVKFNESNGWKWDGSNTNLLEQDQQEANLQPTEVEVHSDDEFNDTFVRGIKPIIEI